jgi:hypothetical protein
MQFLVHKKIEHFHFLISDYALNSENVKANTFFFSDNIRYSSCLGDIHIETRRSPIFAV